MAGVVTERAANVGLNVDTSAKLFTVVDLSSVWVVGALYERDFSRVRTTLRKHGGDLLEFLTEALRCHRTGTSPPRLLPAGA